MIYALIVLGIAVLSFLFILINEKFKKASPLFWKIVAVLFFAVFLVRLGLNDYITYGVIAGQSTLMSPTMVAVVSVLRWASLVGVLIATVTPFFNVKTLKNIASFFLPFVVVLNIIFFRTHLIAFEGASFSFVSLRAIQFAAEIVLMGTISAYYLFKKIKEKDFDNLKEQAKYFFIVLPLLFISIIPLDFFKNIFGYIGGEAEDFTLTHRITFYITFLAPALLFVGLRKKSYHIQRSALILMSLACLITYLYTYDVTNLSFRNLPLHLCNTAVFLMLIAFVFKSKPVFYFNYIVNVIGGIIAIVLPDTSGAITTVGNMHFWYNHIYIVFLPILARLFGHFTRPTLKLMRGAIIIFSIYFVSMIFANAWINTFESVDYFFLYGDNITSKFTFADPWRINNVLTFVVNGGVWRIFWLYDILVFVAYIFMMFMIWYLYSVVYRVEDHYSELISLRAIDTLEMRKFKKELKGKPITSPINEEGINMIKISHFSKVYGHNKHKSVDDFNLEINAGEVFGFLGHNGAGKSTLIKSLVGIQSITEGTIEICGYNIAKQPLQAKRNVGYVSDNHAVYENLTGREYVNYVADLYMVSKEDRTARLNKYTQMFNLTNAIDNQIKTYSHGMKQKLVVIAALIHNPKVWILDEPLTGLDPTSAYQIKECMREHANNGNIVFFSSHIIEVVEKICDKIAIIKQGKLQGMFDVQKLKEDGVELEQLYLKYVNSDEQVAEAKKTEETKKPIKKRVKKSWLTD